MTTKKKHSYTLAMKIFTPVAKLFTKEPEIIYLCDKEKIADKAIYISNHSATSGPILFSLYFPKFFHPWGTYEMCGTFKERWNYLYHIFYRKKKQKGKVSSFIMSCILGVLAIIFYRSIGLLPTYTDLRMVNTVKKSMDFLDEEKGILIFPEDSMEGYKTVLEKYNPGFIALAHNYFKTRKFDLPIYTIYFSKECNTIVFDDCTYINQFFEQNKSKEEIATMFRDRTNELYYRYIEPKIAKLNSK